MRSIRGIFSLTIFISLFASATVVAGNLPSVPNSFTAGSAAKAAEVNANFEAVRAAADDNATTISGKVNKSGDTMTGTGYDRGLCLGQFQLG